MAGRKPRGRISHNADDERKAPLVCARFAHVAPGVAPAANVAHLGQRRAQSQNAPGRGGPTRTLPICEDIWLHSRQQFARGGAWAGGDYG
jgi:hypothetical protein